MCVCVCVRACAAHAVWGVLERGEEEVLAEEGKQAFP